MDGTRLISVMVVLQHRLKLVKPITEVADELGVTQELKPYGKWKAKSLAIDRLSALSAIWMIATTWLSMVRIKEKFAGGYELDAISLALAAIGGGRLSLDYLRSANLNSVFAAISFV